MYLMIGLGLIPVVLGLCHLANSVTTGKRVRTLCHTLLAVLPLLFLAACVLFPREPFVFAVDYSMLYMLCTGKIWGGAAVIFLFSPFMWICVIHFAQMALRCLRIRKKARLKGEREIPYYRGDLDKVSPATVALVSTLEVDLRKSLTAAVLKLKQGGWLKEAEGRYVRTGKNGDSLPESERMILNRMAGHPVPEELWNRQYREAVRREALDDKYLVQNRGGVLLRLGKILLTVLLPLVLLGACSRLDRFTFENYWVDPQPDGTVYIWLGLDADVEKLMDEVKDLNDYGRCTMSDGRESYEYDEIRADRFRYSVVRKAWALHVFTAFAFLGALALCVVSAYQAAVQIASLHKSCLRTRKGRVLLSKAYALRNFLKDYSMVKDRTEAELGLWEYYLIYAVVLGVNEKIEDEVLEKFRNTVC